MDRYLDSYWEKMKGFIDCLKCNTDPPVTGKDGLLALVIELAANKSIKANHLVKLDEII